MALTGNLTETSFTDLIQFYSMSRQTAVVTIVSPAGRDHDGVLYLEGGDVVDARFGELTGLDAVRRALRLKDGEFRVELNVKCRERTIFEPWGKVVLEEMCSDDEALNAEIAGGARDDLDLENAKATMDNAEKPASASRPPSTPRPLPKTLPPPVLKRRAPAVWAIGAGVAVAAVIAAAAFFLRPHPAEPPPPPAPAAAPAAPPRAKVAGVTDTEILFGMSAPFSGPAKELGRGMKTGIEIAFAATNDAGGINGRKLKLLALDDGYEPDRTRAVMKDLAEQRQVFGFIGNVGTPTAEVAVPYALEKKMLFFGPFTGAGLLRKDPPDRYVFNYRASYAEETAATVKYLIDVKRLKPSDIAVFAQQDGYGDAGFNGVAKMMRTRYGRDPAEVLRVGYKRNTSDVSEATDAILKARPRLRAVIMVATYKAAAKFIDKVKADRSDLIFTNVSFVGSQALADELIGYGPKDAEGVIITQVVPLPQSRSTAVSRYQELLPKYSLGEKPDFVSLEGYLAASLLIEGLRKAGRDLDTEKLVDALEGLRGVELGVGATMGFGMSEHQASHKVWGTVLDASGAFETFDME